MTAAGARNLFEVDTDVVHALMQARYYDGSKGEFLSEDPVFLGDPRQQNLADPQSLNSYSYANDNPINRSDPTGRAATLASVLSGLKSVLQALQTYLGGGGGNFSSGGPGGSRIGHTQRCVEE